MYTIKKKRRVEKTHTELPADGAATSQATSNNQDYYNEMSTEGEPKEIMNARSDRAELSNSCMTPPVELDTHRTSNFGIFARS